MGQTSTATGTRPIAGMSDEQRHAQAALSFLGLSGDAPTDFLGDTTPDASKTLADIWRGGPEEGLFRRLAAFRYEHTTSSANTADVRFKRGVLAAERLKDLVPSLILALFERHVVLEPGDGGPLPYGDATACELLRRVNARELSGPLFEAARRAGAALADGCAVVGIVDYRPWAFAAAGGAERPHEMHKVLLRVPPSELSSDVHGCALSALGVKRSAPVDEAAFRIAFEARVLAMTSAPLCLDPDPIVFQRLTNTSYDIRKAAAHLRPAATGAFSHSPSVAPSSFQPSSALVPADAMLRGLHSSPSQSTSTHAERFVRRTLRPLAGAPGPVSPARLRILIACEENARLRRRADSEALYGLDARKDPARLGLGAPPSFSWVPPGAAVWRSVRFEARPGNPPVFYSLHVTAAGVSSALTSGAVLPRFEALLRIGSAPCTNDLCAHSKAATNNPRRPAHPAAAVSRNRLVFATASRAAMETYVDGLRAALAAEGRVCVADVSNPAIFGAGQPLAVAAAAAGHRAAAAVRSFTPHHMR